MIDVRKVEGDQDEATKSRFSYHPELSGVLKNDFERLSRTSTAFESSHTVHAAWYSIVEETPHRRFGQIRPSWRVMKPRRRLVVKGPPKRMDHLLGFVTPYNGRF